MAEKQGDGFIKMEGGGVFNCLPNIHTLEKYSKIYIKFKIQAERGVGCFTNRGTERERGGCFTKRGTERERGGDAF